MHLYIHVPFCARRCSYCDFAIAVRREVPSRVFADAVLQEWRTWQSHPLWNGSGEIETIYFGGGTPSLLAPDQLGRILEGVRGARPVASGAEITIEVNPDDVSSMSADQWVSLGINRISMGVQSFDPGVLSWMHRTHTSADVPEAVQALREAGVSNVSLDLIFALPPHLGRDWERDLELAFALEPEHLSLYGLTVEERTPLARWVARGEATRSDDGIYAAEFLAADAALKQQGYQHYEVSNAAKPGFRSRHNSAYWTRRSVIGLGPSAHSGFGNHRQWNLREWSAYQSALARGRPVLEGQESLDSAAVALEDLYLGLRTIEGLPREGLPEPVTVLWVEEGWAEVVADRLRLTPEGWLRLDALVTTVEIAGIFPPGLSLEHARTAH